MFKKIKEELLSKLKQLATPQERNVGGKRRTRKKKKRKKKRRKKKTNKKHKLHKR